MIKKRVEKETLNRTKLEFRVYLVGTRERETVFFCAFKRREGFRVKVDRRARAETTHTHTHTEQYSARSIRTRETFFEHVFYERKQLKSVWMISMTMMMMM